MVWCHPALKSCGPGTSQKKLQALGLLHPPVVTDGEGRQELGLKRKESQEKRKEKAEIVRLSPLPLSHPQAREPPQLWNVGWIEPSHFNTRTLNTAWTYHRLASTASWAVSSPLAVYYLHVAPGSNKSRCREARHFAVSLAAWFADRRNGPAGQGTGKAW